MHLCHFPLHLLLHFKEISLHMIGTQSIVLFRSFSLIDSPLGIANYTIYGIYNHMYNSPNGCHVKQVWQVLDHILQALDQNLKLHVGRWMSGIWAFVLWALSEWAFQACFGLSRILLCLLWIPSWRLTLNMTTFILAQAIEPFLRIGHWALDGSFGIKSKIPRLTLCMAGAPNTSDGYQNLSQVIIHDDMMSFITLIFCSRGDHNLWMTSRSHGSSFTLLLLDT